MRDHLVERAQLVAVVLLKLRRALVQLLLKVVQLLSQAARDSLDRDANLLPRQAIDHLDLPGVGISTADIEANWHALQLPVRVLVAWSLVAPVHAMPDARRLQLGRPFLDEPFDLLAALVVAEDRHHHYLHRRHPGRHDET